MPVTNPVGWLPYGSTDSSVLFYHPLTSVPTNVTIPCTTLSTVGAGSITHHATRGALFNGQSYRIQTLTGGDALINGGQISFQVERAWISTYDASGTASGSEGANTGQTQTAISLLTNSSHLCRWPQRFGGDATAIGINNFGAGPTQSNFYTAAAGGPCINSVGKSDFVTINIGWVGTPSGGRWYFAVDGLVLTRWDAAVTGVTGLGANWYLGSDRGTANTFVASHYIRNLQVSTRPPMFAVHPLLRKVVFWGDSMVKDLAHTHFTGNPYYDVATGLSCVRELQRNGIYPGEVVAQSYGGYTIVDQGSNQLQTQRAALLAVNPTVVCMRAGSNDASFTGYQTSFVTDVKDHISTILAYSTVEYLVMGNVPTRRYNSAAPFTSDVAWINNEMAQLESWWNTTGAAAAGVASKVGRLKVIDTYSYIGRESPPAKTFVGQITGANNDAHWASNGHYLQGRQFGEAILSLLK